MKTLLILKIATFDGGHIIVFIRRFMYSRCTCHW